MLGYVNNDFHNSSLHVDPFSYSPPMLTQPGLCDLLWPMEKAADMMHTGWNRACAPGLASCYRELFHTTHRAQDSILEGEGRGGERPSWDLITVSEAIPDHPAPAKLSQEQSSPSNL